MTVQEKIQKKAKGFGKLAPVFLEGAEFALNNQWISVDEDLPCNHPELIRKMGHATSQVLTLEGDHEIYLNKMIKFGQEWKWVDSKKPHFWAIIHELPI